MQFPVCWAALHFLQETDGSVAPERTRKEKVRKKIKAAISMLDLEDYALHPTERDRLAREASSDIAKMFYAHKGRLIHKWTHYLDIYDGHFSAYRNTPVKMLEIGVSKGGSLELWRKYFGKDATLFGIDIDPECASRVTAPSQARIGSQDDPKFLRSVIDEMGPPDIILDDGSHIGRHQRTSFDTLFPLLREGGLYLIEDLHTAYSFVHWEGGYRRKSTGMELVKDMIDDMHSWYHRKKLRTASRNQIGAIHIYDSLAVIEKRQVARPGYIELQ
jgi:hypothetical protein